MNTGILVDSDEVEEYLLNNPSEHARMTSALIASALTYVGNHYKEFLREAGFSEKEIKGMPSERWFKTWVRDPAVLITTLVHADEMNITIETTPNRH